MPRPVRLLLLLAALHGLAPGAATAQQPLAPADSARRLDSLASALYDQGTPAALRRATTLWLEAERQAVQGGDTRFAAIVLWNAVLATYAGSDFAGCVAIAPRTVDRIVALGDSVQAARTANYLGLCHSRLNQYPAARDAWRRGVALMRGAGLLRDPASELLQNLAMDYAARGRLDSVLPLVRGAEAANLATGDTLTAFKVWFDVGYAVALRPDTTLALTLLQEGLRHPARGDSSSVASTWFVLGRLRFGRNLVDSAIHDFERGLAAIPAAGDKDLHANLRISLGDALILAGRPREALAPLQQAVRIAGDRGSWQVFVLAVRGLAIARELTGDVPGAVATLSGLATAAQSQSDTLTWVLALKQEGGLLGGLLNATLPALGRLAHALSLARVTRADTLADEIVADIGALGLAGGVVPEVRHYLRSDADSMRASGRMRAAALSRFWYARLGTNRDSIAGGMALYRAAAAEAAAGGDPLLEARALSYVGQGWNHLGRADSASVVLDRAVRVLAARGDEAAAEAFLEYADALLRLRRLDSALAMAHRGLALGRRNLEGHTESRGFETVAKVQRARGTPTALRAAVAYYDSSVASLERWYTVRASRRGMGVRAESVMGKEFGAVMAWLGLAPTIGRQQAARGALLALERSRGLVIRQLRSGGTPPPTADAALAGLRQRRGAMLLSAWATDAYVPGARDTLVTLVLDTAGAVRAFVRVLPPDSVAGMLWGIREVCCVTAADTTRAAGAAAAGRATLPDPRGSLERLSRTILTPDVLAAFAGAREILLEPDLSLSIALFAAAPTGRDGEPFGVRYPFRYVPALAFGAGRGQPAARMPAVVVGNPTMPTIRSDQNAEVALAPLPGALAEAQWVAERLGTTALTGDAATETALRARLPSARVIHLATHGLAYRSLWEPRAPLVALAPDSLNDGVLSLREILDDPSLRLTADLVVLSACQSGLGEMSGEGLNGLQRAFLARGARSVLYSLWNVSDEATALFMQRFYQHWLDDPDHPGKSESLRRARVDVRADPRFREPRFWAAFQLVGED